MDGHDAAGEVAAGTDGATTASSWREVLREQALERAMRKMAAGVPTYSVPEASVLMSVSQEHLYRLIQAGAFPAVHMREGGRQGRYVVPANVIKRLLDAVVEHGGCLEIEDWVKTQHVAPGGVA